LMGRVVLQGELRPFGLLNTLQILHNASLSGALRIHEFGLTFTLYVDRGFLVSAASPEQQPLGARLVAKGRISRQDLDEALRKQLVGEQRGEPQTLGAVLMQDETVTQADLEECVFDQIVETLCLSLELPSPYFSFTDFEGDEANEARAYVHFQFALFEAFRIAEEIRGQRGVDVTPRRMADGRLHEMIVRRPDRAEVGT
jgi:hypothetical protein